MAFYGDDLTFVHDAGFTGYVRGAMGGLLAMLRERGINDGLVVDLGCGGGVWAGELVDHGYDAHGVDISEAMIELCKTRVDAPPGRRVSFECASLHHVELPRCRAVTAIGECLNYVASEDAVGGVGALFGKIHDALEPGGFLAFDALLPGCGDKRVGLSGDDWAIISENSEDAQKGEYTRRITTFRRDEATELYRRAEEMHRLRLIARDELVRLMESAGFDVETGTRYGEFEIPPGRAVFIGSR
ncbi:MAG: class I SAM-dependent methyltransferase [Phycisphaerales bacterium JB043]